MRQTAVPIAVLVLLTACPPSTYFNPPPKTRFYYPTGVVHADLPGSDAGVLFVANANFNKLYNSGSIGVVKLDEVGLPDFGAPLSGGPLALTDLGPGAQTMQVTSFTGEMAALELAPGKLRLFVPSRSEGMKYQALDATLTDGGVVLSCFPAAPAGSPTDCGANAPSLSPAAFEQSPGGVPRAVAPYGVAIQRRVCDGDAVCGPGRTCGSGYCLTDAGEAFADTWVTHLVQADSPIASGLNFRSYLVRVESDQMLVAQANYVNLGVGSATSAAAGKRWVYVTGRLVSSAYPYPYLMRLVSHAALGPDAGDLRDLNANTSLESFFRAQDARGTAVGSREDRLYMLSRAPDSLVVASLTNTDGTSFPTVQVVKSVALPNGPNEVVVIPRPGRGDLVAVTSSGASVLALYDEDLGELAAQVTSIGQQPFGIAFDRRGAGVRIFVTNFADGRVAVVDVPDLDRPQEARLVAHLGQLQTCLTNPTLSSCLTAVTP
jgi:hypothetical protein